MPRPCGPCQDKRRNEIDRRLLEMEISGETYRSISHSTGYTEWSLKRHKKNHLTLDLSNVKNAMQKAREAELSKIEAEERERRIEAIVEPARESLSTRLQACKSLFDQLNVLREKAAIVLDKAEAGEDLKTALQAIRELREMVKLWGELDGKLQPTLNVSVDIYSSPEWEAVGRVLAELLEPESPALRERVASRLLELAEERRR